MNPAQEPTPVTQVSPIAPPPQIPNNPPPQVVPAQIPVTVPILPAQPAPALSVTPPPAPVVLIPPIAPLAVPAMPPIVPSLVPQESQIPLPAPGIMPGVVPTQNPPAAPPVAHASADTKVFGLLILAIVGVVLSLIPVLGIPLCITALALGTASLNSPRKSIVIASLIIAPIGLLLSIGMFGYGFVSQSHGLSSALGILASLDSGKKIVASTSCFDMTFAGKTDIVQTPESCKLTAKAVDRSSYVEVKGYINKEDTLSMKNIKYTADDDYDILIKGHPAAKLTRHQEIQFAGQPAYVVELVENSIYTGSIFILNKNRYKVSNGKINVFIIDYISQGKSYNYAALSKSTTFK